MLHNDILFSNNKANIQSSVAARVFVQLDRRKIKTEL